MERNRWGRIDSAARLTHLYAGLFLAPWLLVYATSGFCLNHGRWINERLRIKPPQWDVLREVPFVPHDTFPRTPAEQAEALLRRVDLEGPHFIVGKPTPQQMIINRAGGGSNYRVTWRRPRSLIIVERQQPFSFYRLLHFLHLRHGYGQPYFVQIAWAVLVDATTIALWLWVLTGVYIWIRRPRQRVAGGLCVAAGSVLFIVLVALFCL